MQEDTEVKVIITAYSESEANLSYMGPCLKGRGCY